MRGDRLEDRDLVTGVERHLEVGGKAGEWARSPAFLGGALRGVGEPADQCAGQALQHCTLDPAAVVLRRGPLGHLLEPQGRRVEPVVAGLLVVPVASHREDRRTVEVTCAEGEPTSDDAVLDVVHRVGDVVGEIHDLRLNGTALGRRALPEPLEDRQVVGVGTELAAPVRSLAAGPGVLHARRQRRARQVEADARTIGIECLGLQSAQDAEGLRIALEASARRGCLVEGNLAVVTEGWVAQVVRESRRVHDVGIAAQRLAQLASHLGDLERVGEAIAYEVVEASAHDLRLRRQPAQRRRMYDACTIALERRATRTLGRLVDKPLPSLIAVRIHE